MSRYSLTIRRSSVRRTILLLLVLLLLTISAFPSAQGKLWARAAAMRQGDFVDIDAETVLIIWDADTKTQQFIYRATFDTTAKDFGFLVPTPSRPELSEAHDFTFKILERITAAPRTTRLKIVSPAFKKASASGAKATVQVIETKRVGDYDAVVFRADDAKVLNEWLEKNGYAADDALTDWLGVYVKRGWFLTAFKIVKESQDQLVATAPAVRMSFATEQPFFPYREPVRIGDAARYPFPPERLLRIYFLAGSRMSGTLGDARSWLGKTVWSGAMPPEENGFLLYALRMNDKAKGRQWWLTEFADDSAPLAGPDEVYFSASKDQSTVTRPPIVEFITHSEAPPSPLTPGWAFALGTVSGAVLLAIIGFLLSRRRRHKEVP